MNYIKKFNTLRMQDVGVVGGKNASLGEMISALVPMGVRIPDGFATTAQAYWYYINYNNLLPAMQQEIAQLGDAQDIKKLQKAGAAIRAMLEHATMPDDLAQEIIKAYHELSAEYNQPLCDVAVRSSATAEDLPTASFAGQQETYLNVRGDKELIESCKKCYASLFTDRAIIYRMSNGFDHFEVALSIGVQKMIRSDLSCSGVAFSLDTESGFKDVVMINGSWGLGESIVQGLVIPDEFIVHKPTLQSGYASIIKKQLGDKQTKIIYTQGSQAWPFSLSLFTSSTAQPTKTVPVQLKEHKQFVLNDQEILELAHLVIAIEKHYSDKKGSWSPMDIEWAKDGVDNKLYIIQARPETVHAQDQQQTLITWQLKDRSNLKTVITGQSIGQQIVCGTARVIASARDIEQVQAGDIIVTVMTDPDWVPAMKKAAGIITERGGRTCHAAIVSRELKIPAIIGAEQATTTIKSGQIVTLDCSQGKTGYVYDGALSFQKEVIVLGQLPKVPVQLMVNIADPDGAFTIGRLPTDGVGLARLEFIINNVVKIHPMALIEPEKVKDQQTQQLINDITQGYQDKKQFFIDTVAQGVGMIAASFYPRPVIVRLSDFKSNEYRNLIGGTYFEPVEENPMIGFRGASRYYNPAYAPAFALECAALKKVRDDMGLKNVKIMVPFVRTVREAQEVFAQMAHHGLVRGADGLEVIMMCEIPSNVILIDEFSELFDGFSIGSNDLTQLTLGVDRDSAMLSAMFDERDPAAIKMFEMAVIGAKRNKKHIGICGQAPSDFPEIAQFLIACGIDSLSLNADSVIPFIMSYKK